MELSIHHNPWLHPKQRDSSLPQRLAPRASLLSPKALSPWGARDQEQLPRPCRQAETTRFPSPRSTPWHLDASFNPKAKGS